MQLRRIEVAGFRSFESRSSIGDLNRINVFVGRNNAGKTNIIEILRLLRGMLDGTVYRKPEDFITRGQKDVSLVMTFSLEDGERTQTIERMFKGGGVEAKDVVKTSFLKTAQHSLDVGPQGIVQETVSASNLMKGHVVVWSQSREQVNAMTTQGCDLSQACRALQHWQDLSVALEPRAGRGAPTWELLWLGAIKNVDFLPLWIRNMYLKIDWAPPIRQSQVQMPPTEVKRLDSSGSNLPQVWNTIVSDEPEELVTIGKDVGRIVGITSISAPVRGNQTVPSLKEASGDSFDLSNTSSGVQQAAILATKIRTCPADGILLIEEPELHLHAGAQRALREIIANRSADVQFFVTTHSTIFTDLGDNSNVFLVTRQGRQSSIRSISQLAHLKLVKSELGHSNVDLYGYDSIVFVEGDSEELALPIIADCLGFDLRRSGILLQNLKGASKAKKLRQYLEYLRDTGIVPFVVADGSEEVKDKVSDWEGSGLLPTGNHKVWKQEFEDLFSLDAIAECLAELGYTGMSASELGAQKGTDAVVHAIGRLIRETMQQDLDKPALAEALARKACANKGLLPTELKELFVAFEKQLGLQKPPIQ